MSKLLCKIPSLLVDWTILQMKLVYLRTKARCIETPAWSFVVGFWFSGVVGLFALGLWWVVVLVLFGYLVYSFRKDWILVRKQGERK